MARLPISRAASLFGAASITAFGLVNCVVVLMATAFVTGDQGTQAALAAAWKSTLDPYGLFGFGGVGLWVLVLSVLGLRQNQAPRAVWSPP